MSQKYVFELNTIALLSMKHYT